MRLRNLVNVLVYTPKKTNEKGEYITKWTLKGITHLNRQQNLNELDRNSSGDVDYELIKLHADSPQDIVNGDGISFETTDGLKYEDELILHNDNTIVQIGTETDESPKYIVKASPKIGKSTVYTCKTNDGD